MENIERVKILLSVEDFNNIRDFIRGYHNHIDEIIFKNSLPNEKELITTIRSVVRFVDIEMLSLKIELLDKDVRIDICEMEIRTLNQLIGVFSLADFDNIDYMVKIDVDTELNKKRAIGKIQTIEFNSNDFSYLRNLSLFNNFNDDFQLLESCVSLLIGVNRLIPNPFNQDFIDLLIEKFEYYGFNKNNVVDINDVLNGIIPNNTTQEILNNLVGVVLDVLYGGDIYREEKLYIEFATDQANLYINKVY